MIGYYSTMIQVYTGVDPKNLSLSQWAEKVAQIKDIRESESKGL